MEGKWNSVQGEVSVRKKKIEDCTEGGFMAWGCEKLREKRFGLEEAWKRVESKDSVWRGIGGTVEGMGAIRCGEGESIKRTDVKQCVSCPIDKKC
jgi:hypothetical protein